MKSNSFVSVIVTTYNSSSTIIETLESVINQTYLNLELLIFDDCSEDNTVEKINDFFLNKNIKVTLFSSKLNAQRVNKLVLLDSIFEYICEKKIQHSNIVMRQVILETGWLKSKFLMSKNNIFGFRHKKYLSFNFMGRFSSLPLLIDWR
jgi:glycosyltransferase involved in cell wall biosynthesis